MTKLEYIKLLISEMDADEFVDFVCHDWDAEYAAWWANDLKEEAKDIKITNLQNLRSMVMNDDTLISMFFGWSELHRDGCPKGAHEVSKCADDIDCRMCYKMWGELPCDNIGELPEFIDHGGEH